jgi:hypothetical protein
MPGLDSTIRGAGIGEPTEPSFPSLYLDGSQLKALGLTADDMGKVMKLTANVRLDSLSLASGEGDGSATLTVMDGEVEKEEEPTSNEERATRIFDGDLI